MASITERGGRFLVRVRRGGFNPVAKTFTRKQDGTAWGRKVEADMEAGRWQDIGTQVPTLGEAITLYRAGPARKLKGAATYAYWLDELATSSLAARPLGDITPPALSAWRDAQEAEGLMPGTVVRKMGLLSGLLTWCHKERGWLTSNPMRSVTKPRVNDARGRTLADDELAALQAAASTSKAAWLGDAIVVLVRSAMRRGELWGMKIEDIDFDQFTAHLADTKNGSARDVPLDPMALEALQRLAAAARLRGTVNIIPVGHPHAVSLAFRRTVARARQQHLKDCATRGTEPDPGFLIDLHLHDMRHTAVSRVAQSGGLNLIELAAVSGHRSLKMVQRYAHIDAAKLAVKLAGIAA